MKIALCLSGHLRSFEFTAKYLKSSLLDKFDVDVFLHTWNFLGNAPNIDGASVHIKTSSKHKEIKNLYNPKNIAIQPFQYFSGEKYRKHLIDRRCPNGVFNMFMKIFQCNKIKNDFKLASKIDYDVVIRCRPDLIVDYNFTNDFMKEVSSSNCLWVSNCGHFSGINDQFAMGPEIIMNKYSEFIKHFDSIILQEKFVPELLLNKYIKESNILVNEFDFTPILKRYSGAEFNMREFSNERYK